VILVFSEAGSRREPAMARGRSVADDTSRPATYMSHPEGNLPAGIPALARPERLARATALAFLRFQKSDLDATLGFLTDFGMELVSRTERRMVMRGAGPAPCIYIAEKGPRSRFVGAAFVMAPETDFASLEQLPGAQRLAAAEVPGGGRGVELIDPAGN